MSDSGDGYDVGYGKPPKHTRFKTGESGNPRGRPRGARGLKGLLKEELGKKVTIQEEGKQIKLTKQELVIKQLLNKAGKGDLRAMPKVFELMILFDDEADHTELGKRSLAPDDRAILEDWAKQQFGDEGHE